MQPRVSLATRNVLFCSLVASEHSWKPFCNDSCTPKTHMAFLWWYLTTDSGLLTFPEVQGSLCRPLAASQRWDTQPGLAGFKKKAVAIGAERHAKAQSATRALTRCSAPLPVLRWSGSSSPHTPWAASGGESGTSGCSSCLCCYPSTPGRWLGTLLQTGQECWAEGGKEAQEGRKWTHRPDPAHFPLGCCGSNEHTPHGCFPTGWRCSARTPASQKRHSEPGWCHWAPDPSCSPVPDTPAAPAVGMRNPDSLQAARSQGPSTA